MNEKQLAKLIRQNAAKAEKKATARKGRTFDPTLEATQGTDDDIERQRMFKEMKRREF